MAEHGFALFTTPIGRCAIAWSERGITAVRLPERRDSETRARLLKRFPHAREALPPRPVQDALERIVALLARGSICPRSRSTWTACRISIAKSIASPAAFPAAAPPRTAKSQRG